MEGCLSTHGGAGYAPDTYINDNRDIICGNCKDIIGSVYDGKPRVKIPNWVRKPKRNKERDWPDILRRLCI